MPPSTEFLAQYQALTLGVGFSRLDRSRLTLRGPDRVALLHSFCTNDIKQLQPGGGCEAFITTPQGKTLGHIFVFHRPDELLLSTSAGQAETLTAHLNRFVLSEDVEIADCTVRYATLLVGGPKAAAALERLAGFTVPSAMLQSTAVKLCGEDAMICRVPYTGADSFFVHLPSEHAADVEAALSDAGAIRCETSAVESARLEAGFPRFGSDITEDNLPQEVGRNAQAISFQKGCYLGQETIARIDAIGHVNRRLVGVKLDSETIPNSATPLLLGDKPVGQITSAAWSPLLHAPLAFGYVRTAHASAGTALTSPAGTASVVTLPVQGT